MSILGSRVRIKPKTTIYVVHQIEQKEGDPYVRVILLPEGIDLIEALKNNTFEYQKYASLEDFIDDPELEHL